MFRKRWWVVLSPQQQTQMSRWRRCSYCLSDMRRPAPLWPKCLPFYLWWRIIIVMCCAILYWSWKWHNIVRVTHLGCCCGTRALTCTTLPQTPPGGCKPSATETSACGWTLCWWHPEHTKNTTLTKGSTLEALCFCLLLVKLLLFVFFEWINFILLL